MIRISFLLPCYKVEKYIKECIDSIYATKLPLEEFEVICFDDCSPDATPYMLDQLAIEHANMRVIHSHVNVGSGGGRNRLLQDAKGQYLWFIDPDDLVVSNQVTSLLFQAESQGLDVLLFNYLDMLDNGLPLESGSTFRDSIAYDGLTFTDNMFGNDIVWHMGYPWRFLVRRDYLNEIHLQFPERMVFQDTVWMPKLIIYASRVQSTKIVGYYYRRHDASVCGTFDTIYPGRSIYTWTLLVSNLLLEFAAELERKRDKDSRYQEYAKLFRKFAVSHYIMMLPLLLSRTQRKERKVFYSLIQEERIPSSIKPYFDLRIKILLLPHMGFALSNVMAAIYSFKHRN